MKSLHFLLVFLCIAIAVGCSQSSGKSHSAPEHIVIVIEENHGFDQIIGNSDAPYINQLAHEGLLFTNAHAITHPSQPNYIALFSGSMQGVNSDRCLKHEGPYNTPNLGHELIEIKYTFTGYSESIPKNGFKGCDVGESRYPNGGYLYGRLHNPWVDWQGNTPTGLPASTNLSFDEFPDNFDELPTVAIVVPNKDNDMHNGPDSLTIKRADNWLKNNMSDYIKWSKKNNSLFILTYDEDQGTVDNHIPTLFVGAQIQAGQNDTRINHYNVLRTIEKLCSLPNAGPAKEKAIEGVWGAAKKQQKQQSASSLKLNQIQVVGTHNSYKVAIDSALIAMIAAKDSSAAKSLSYAHLPVSKQLDLGVRNLEYDVYFDPKGGLFSRPNGLTILKEKNLPHKSFADSALYVPGLKVFHIPDLDFRSHHLLFRDALNELKTWSEEHPDHLPVFITMNTKDGQIEDDFIETQPLPFTESALDSVDSELKRFLGTENLITPDMVRKMGETLKESIVQDGWPDVDSLRGRFLFILDQSGPKMERYINHHPSLKGRMMFVNAPENYPEAATMIINDPIADQDRIQQMVREGFIVRTRADANTREARENSYKRWEAAKSSGAQIITTDYIVPSQTFSSSYQVKLESTYRVNLDSGFAL